jgi:N-acetyl-anhydromuramyl-L-alanine amidase AmpD
VWVDTVVMHFTAGRGDADSTARLFANPKRGASAHFCVGRDGKVVQCVSVKNTAWHAGDGKFPSAEQLESGVVIADEVKRVARVMNRRSIGIELCNRGFASGGRNPYV